MSDGLSNYDLTRLYTWVNKINLPTPRVNIALYFSDGVLAAEVWCMLW